MINYLIYDDKLYNITTLLLAYQNIYIKYEYLYYLTCIYDAKNLITILVLIEQQYQIFFAIYI